MTPRFIGYSAGNPHFRIRFQFRGNNKEVGLPEHRSYLPVSAPHLPISLDKNNPEKSAFNA
jgi:hypothetical protein